MEIDQPLSAEDPLNVLARLVCQLNTSNLDFANSASFFKSLESEIKKKFNALDRRAPKPICTNANLTPKDWKIVEKVADHMTSDYAKRAELITRRLDVTVDSFFWSERVQQLESKVNEVYNPKRELLLEWKPISVEDVLAATEDLLVLEKASSYKQRIATKCDISNFTMKENPKDRGGRTGEVIAPLRETFTGQQHSRGQQRGGYRGRGNFKRFSDQREGRFEEQVKREYSGNRGGHRDGGNRGAR